MIVSGFTQRKSHLKQMEEAMPAGKHSHCVRCYQANCSKFVDNFTVCVIVTCQACGWRCHECKLLEHVLMCPEERVTCLNKEYGCPHMLKRSKMASHLAVCPASVVFCAEEWSRWPMHAREQGVRMPLPQEKNYVDCGQLDVGLAMRDQRMLIDSLRAPRKLRQTLRNSLTQIYPAAPFPQWRSSFDSDPAISDGTSQTVSEDDADAPWDLSKTHPGLKESIRSRLFRVTKETADSLIAALEITSHSLSSSQFSEVSEAGDGSTLHNTAETKSALCDSLPRSISSMESSESAESCLSWPGQISLDSAADKNVTGNNNQLLMEDNCKQSNVIQEVQEANLPTEHLERSSMSSDRFSDVSSKSRSTLHDVGGRQLHKLIGCSPEQDLSDEIRLHKVLGVSINIECINKYVTKPPSMYTFICAQNFRRDEYHWHFKNVHLDIHTGLSGWLEQRCPLANLGCTFSFQRLEPRQPNTVIYHSWLQESFGLHNILQPSRHSIDSDAVVSSKHYTDNATSSVSKQTNDVKFSQTVEKHCPHYKGQLSRAISDTNSTFPADSDSNSFSIVANNDANSISSITDGFVSTNNSNSNAVDKSISYNNLNSSIIDKSTSTNSLNSSTVDTFISLDNHMETRGEPEAFQNNLNSEEQDGHSRSNFMRVWPMIYTASSWDSKVLFQYDMEAEGKEELTEVVDVYHSLTHLPFEVLRHIARQLDSFSLCNLALTCHVLRDVCCSLLDECGIVLLSWQKERSEVTGRVSWKVASKRWMFSTSFEPVHSWRFRDIHPTIGDHLKACPYNKDIVQHTKPFAMFH